jgi:tetratricopeptide (TPR) repeat protein
LSHYRTFAVQQPRRRILGSFYWIAFFLLVCLSVTLAFVPLFNVLGYEVCALLSLLASITSGPITLRIVRHRLSDPLPINRPAHFLIPVYIRAVFSNLVLFLPPLFVMLLNAFRVQNCNLAKGWAFFGLLPLSTIVICSAWGLLAGTLSRRRFVGGFLYASIWLFVAGINVAEVWRGPATDSYNQLIGWLAGPIYDEVVEPSWTLLLSRCHGFVWAVFLLTSLGALLDTNQRRVRLSAFSFFRPSFFIAFLFGAASLLFFKFGTSMGFRHTDHSVHIALPQTILTDHFVLHVPASLSKKQISLLAEDHEFRYHQLSSALEPLGSDKIHSYLFPDSNEKRRLTGAGRTQFSKPWQPAIFLNGFQFPHPTLKHELVHAMAASFGSWPTRLSSNYGLWINLGLTEGLAVALDWPVDPIDPHASSAALRRIGKSPDVRNLMNPVHFWTASARKSYTVAGSFVRHLISRYGMETFRKAYQSGGFDGVYPKPLDELIAEWEKMLDELPLDPSAIEKVREHFSATSVFERTCAHEISALQEQARRAMNLGQLERAQIIADRILHHLPNDVEAERMRIEILSRLHFTDEATTAIEKLLNRDDVDPLVKIDLYEKLGDLHIQQGDLNSAEKCFLRVIDSSSDEFSKRMSLIKLHALRQGKTGAAVLDYLQQGKGTAEALLLLYEAAAQSEDGGHLWYLLGRALFNQEAFESSRLYLARAAKTGLGHSVLIAENYRLLIQSSYRSGNLEEAANLLAVFSLFPERRGDGSFTNEWLMRIAFLKNDANHFVIDTIQEL